MTPQANRKEQEEYEEQMATLDDILSSEFRTDSVATGKEESAESDDKLKKRANKGAWGAAKEKVDVQVSVERVQNFEEAFLKIKAATGISDIDELVRTFIKNEDQNFSLFNYVNEQTVIFFLAFQSVLLIKRCFCYVFSERNRKIRGTNPAT